MTKACYQEHREEILAKKKVYRQEHREERYGLASGEFKRMLAKQGGVCAICGGLGGKKGLFIDHDHKSGKVRDLLCSNCNSALGLLKDSSKLVAVAAKYLKKHGK